MRSKRPDTKRAAILLVSAFSFRELERPLFRIWRETIESTRWRHRHRDTRCLNKRHLIAVYTARISSLLICSSSVVSKPFHRQPQTVFQRQRRAGIDVRKR